MKICSICGSDKKIIHHHLSYEPEIIMLTCKKCSGIMHNSVGLSKKQFDIIFKIVEQYGDQWDNGGEKYKKTKHYKSYQKEYKKTDKYKNYIKEYRKIDRVKNKLKEYNKEYDKNYRKTDKYKNYQKGYRFKNLTPEKQRKYLDKMENKQLLIDIKRSK